jgi:hypothetical protein
MAQSRVHRPLPGLPHLPADDTDVESPPEAYCPRTAELEPAGAEAYLAGLRRERETLSLEWTLGRVAVFNSRGVRRRTEVTSAALQVRHSRRPGSGRAATAARSLGSIHQPQSPA